MNVVDVDRQRFAAYFDRKPFYVRHALAEHPLFQLERLIELARRLPKEFVEYNAGNLPVGIAEPSPSNGLSAEETLRRIAECGSWLVLKRVEQDTEYARLLNACLDEIEAKAGGLAPRGFDRQGFIFVSSPRSVTPLHMDPEHNFLLQIRGTKTVRQWDPQDRYVVAEQDLETFHARFVHRNLPFKDEFEATAHVLPLKPGEGLHFPVTCPHWVQNGDEVSISFSITFRSELSERRARLHRVNAKLRGLGLEPTPVGTSPLVDGAKDAAARALSRVKGLVSAARDRA